VSRYTYGVAHIMEAVKTRDKVEVLAGKVIGRSNFEAHVRNLVAPGVVARLFD
jgi:hypothetical protein